MLLTTFKQHTQVEFSANELSRINGLEREILGIINSDEKLLGNVMFVVKLVTQLNIDIARFLNKKVNYTGRDRFTDKQALKGLLDIIWQSSDGYNL